MVSLHTLLKGGYVEFHRGAWRVHGILCVSRSIGDAHLKDWVLAEPDTKILKLTPDMEFLVLASDGLWEEVRNQCFWKSYTPCLFVFLIFMLMFGLSSNS